MLPPISKAEAGILLRILVLKNTPPVWSGTAISCIFQLVVYLCLPLMHTPLHSMGCVCVCVCVYVCVYVLSALEKVWFPISSKAMASIHLGNQKFKQKVFGSSSPGRPITPRSLKIFTPFQCYYAWSAKQDLWLSTCLNLWFSEASLQWSARASSAQFTKTYC